MKLAKRILTIVILLVIVSALVFAFLPKPLLVETQAIAQGPLVVTVDGDGRTRIKERFVVSAQVAGQMPRLELHPGDKLTLGAVLTTIAPIDSALLDPRSRAQAQAQAGMSRAGRAQAKSRVDLAQTSLDQARTQLERIRALAQRGGVPEAEFEAAQFRERSAAAELDAAKFGAKVAQFELESAEASLLRLNAKPSTKPDAVADGHVTIRSPVDGTVLRVFQENAGPVALGTPLLEIGSPAALEVVVDLLSVDAVLVVPNAEVKMERWGGEAPLEGRVQLVEPSGTTKVSALGIEEQRVNVIVDFTSPPEAYQALGDGYRVAARIVVYEAPSAVQVPLTALFRKGEDWAVFMVEDGRAILRKVEIGRRSERAAEVLKGLSAGQQVVVHPSDKLEDGSKVQVRSTP